MVTYYNENDPYAAQWLRNLIDAGHIAPGFVDERSIKDVSPQDLIGFTQCHFFAGIGGWSYAARLAGWPDERPLWTGSCPCQPFSVAGQQKGQADERHLWPTFFALINARRPAVVMGEQVAAAVGKDWLDGVYSDMEAIGYSCGAAVVPACAVDAPHRRDRLWFVGDTERERLEGHARHGHIGSESGWLEPKTSGSTSASIGAIPHTDLAGPQGGPHGGVHSQTEGKGPRYGEPVGHRALGASRGFPAWADAEWRIGADGKARRIEPRIRLLAHGVPARVGKLRAYGNAITPQVGAEIIGAYMDVN